MFCMFLNAKSCAVYCDVYNQIIDDVFCSSLAKSIHKHIYIYTNTYTYTSPRCCDGTYSDSFVWHVVQHVQCISCSMREHPLLYSKTIERYYVWFEFLTIFHKFCFISSVYLSLSFCVFFSLSLSFFLSMTHLCDMPFIKPNNAAKNLDEFWKIGSWLHWK